jgi:hypothetical protein
MFYLYEHLFGSKVVLVYAHADIGPEIGIIRRIWFLELSEYKSHTFDRFTNHVCYLPHAAFIPGLSNSHLHQVCIILCSTLKYAFSKTVSVYGSFGRFSQKFLYINMPSLQLMLSFQKL